MRRRKRPYHSCTCLTGLADSSGRAHEKHLETQFLPANNSDQPAEIAEDIRQIRKVGAVGWRYFEEKHHGASGTAGITFNGKSDIDMAVEILNKCADLALPALQSFGHYQKWLADRPMQYIKPTDHLDEK